MHELIKGGSLMCTGGSQKRIDGPHSVKYSISIIPHSGRDLFWNISASCYVGSCIDRSDRIYSSLLLAASGIGMVLCDVSNQLSHFCKARALISIGRRLYGK